ncbi:HSF5 protein, partial [Oxylabes madagascariensis]|nr:HSF5 protein [Oxylabes madagascariensis]
PAGLNASTFPSKLRHLVNSPCVCSVRWDSQAQGLLIDCSLFKRELLRPGGAQGPAPHTFRATQFCSFMCQLCCYGFHKVPGQVGTAALGDAGAWLHYRNPWFHRYCPDFLLHIRHRTTANRQRLVARPDRCRLLPCGSQQ